VVVGKPEVIRKDCADLSAKSGAPVNFRFAGTHPVDRGDLKFETKTLQSACGFVILRGSDDFLQQKTWSITGFKRLAVIAESFLLSALLPWRSADTNLIRNNAGIDTSPANQSNAD